MKTILAIALLLTAPLLTSAAEGWMTDAEAAKARARAENKVLLMEFTGSDWCSFCKMLNGEVFSKDAFKEYAKDNLVLLKLDFPRAAKQSEAEKKQNEALARKHEIQGFPTVLVFGPEGKQLGKLGYQRGGAEAWLSSLAAITKR